jgi:hypothetical protein
MAGKRVIGEDGIRLLYCCIASPLKSRGYCPASAFVTRRARSKTVADEPHAFIMQVL